MIVTCPGCSANYRVRDDAVPTGGAKMRCPRCSTVFLAMAPGGDGAAPASAAATPEGKAKPPPISGLFEAVDPAAGPAQAKTAPAPQARTQSVFDLPATSPGSHRASTSIDQLVAMAGPTAAPAPAPARARAPTPPPPAPAPPPVAAAPAVPANAFSTVAGEDPFAMPAEPPARPGPRGAGPGPAVSDPAALVSVALQDDADDPFASLDLGPGPEPFPPTDVGEPEASIIVEDDDASISLVERPKGRGATVMSLDSLDAQMNAISGGPTNNPGLAGPAAGQAAAGIKTSADRSAERVARAGQGRDQSSASRAAPHAGRSSPSILASLGSWLFLLAGLAVLLGGGGVTAWTLGFLNLDEQLLPVLERELDIRPPYSAIGKDVPDRERLSLIAERAEKSGDMIAAIAAWRRVLALGEDGEARLKLEELYAQIGHRTGL